MRLSYFKSAALFALVTIAGAQTVYAQAPQAPLPTLVAPPAVVQVVPGAPGAVQADPRYTGRPARVRNTPNVSCSDWLQACRKRGGTIAVCTEKRDACIAATGCFTEEPRFGGETFCQLRRQ